MIPGSTLIWDVRNWTVLLIRTRSWVLVGAVCCFLDSYFNVCAMVPWRHRETESRNTVLDTGGIDWSCVPVRIVLLGESILFVRTDVVYTAQRAGGFVEASTSHGYDKCVVLPYQWKWWVALYRLIFPRWAIAQKKANIRATCLSIAYWLWDVFALTQIMLFPERVQCKLSKCEFSYCFARKMSCREPHFAGF